MGRILGILLVAAMIGGAILTYDTKHRAERAGEAVAALKDEAAKERNTIALLRAELSVLTQPGRLQALTERFKNELGLANMEVTQIVTVDEIPTKPVAIGPVAETTAKPAVTKVHATR
jgi:hypothetical protein